MKELNMGLIAGRHEIPEAIDGYILDHVDDPADVNGIRDAVDRSLVRIFKNTMSIKWSIPIDAASDDLALVVRSSVRLNLYVTGLTAAALEVVAFCSRNGIALTAYHYDRATGSYVAQNLINP